MVSTLSTYTDTVLLVEDEAILAISQTQFLESCGYKVYHATDAIECLQHIRKYQDISIVLMDIQLSGDVDGIQIAERVLEFRDVPILFISSYSESQLLNRISNIKHYGFIPKLSSPAVIDCMIKSALRLFEARQEISLREKELRATFESIGDAVIVTDPGGNISKVNRVALDFLGYEKSEIIGKNIESVVYLVHIESRIRLENSVNNAILENKTINRSEHLKLISRNGKETHVSESVSPIFDEDNKLNGAVIVFRDLSKGFEKPISVENKESIYEKAFQLSPIALALTRVKDASYVDINPSLEKMYGLKREEVVGQKYTDFSAWAVEGERERLHAIFTKQGKLVGEKMRIQTNNERIAEILVFAQGFEIAGESFILGMNLDISEQVEMEKKLAKSLEEKEILLKELQHRVKNSLAIVSGLLSMEAFKVKDEAAKRSFLSAQSRITSMSKVYENLYQSQDLETVHLGNYINTLVHSMSDIFILNPLRIRFDLKTDDILLDLKRALPLGLILNELLTNALKYAYPEDKSGVIRVEITKQKENINLVVSDDGNGLPDEVNIEKGSHFGYELIRSLTTQIKGVFSSISKRGEGLTVIIAFPLKEEGPNKKSKTKSV